MEQQVFVDCSPFLLCLNCLPDGFCHGYANESALPSIACFDSYCSLKISHSKAFVNYQLSFTLLKSFYSPFRLPSPRLELVFVVIAMVMNWFLDTVLGGSPDSQMLLIWKENSRHFYKPVSSKLILEWLCRMKCAWNCLLVMMVGIHFVLWKQG